MSESPKNVQKFIKRFLDNTTEVYVNQEEILKLSEYTKNEYIEFRKNRNNSLLEQVKEIEYSNENIEVQD